MSRVLAWWMLGGGAGLAVIAMALAIWFDIRGGRR